MPRSRIQTASPDAVEPKQIPDIHAIASKQRDERQAELSALAGTSPDPAPAAEPAAPAIPAERNWAEEVGKLDQDLVKHIAQSGYDQYDQQLSTEFGGMLPLIAESRSNPTLRKNLELLAQDRELREILADETAPARMRKAADKKLQKIYEDDDFADFVATQALPIWEQNLPAGGVQAAATQQRSPEAERLDRIEARQRETDDANDYRGYINTRAGERQALETAFPHLAKAKNVVARVVGDAERDFQARAAYSGIDTSDNNRYWAAQARRAGIQPPSYHDYYKRLESEYSDYSKVMPAAAPTGAPGDAQQTRVIPETVHRAAAGSSGPKTKAELRQRGVEALAKLEAKKG